MFQKNVSVEHKLSISYKLLSILLLIILPRASDRRARNHSESAVGQREITSTAKCGAELMPDPLVRTIRLRPINARCSRSKIIGFHIVTYLEK